MLARPSSADELVERVGEEGEVRVLVVGAGVIGTVYGAQLAAAGHSMAVLAHGQRTDRVAAAGLAIRDALSRVELVSAVTVVSDASNVSYDLVLVAVQYGQVAAVAPVLAELCGDPTVLYFGNNPGGRPSLAGGLPGEVRLGFPGIGGSFAQGVVEYARIAQQPTALGSVPSPVIEELDRSLQQRGFPTQRVVDMDGRLIYHAVFVASVTAALCRCDTDPVRLAGEHQAMSLMCRGISEGFAALRRQGVGGAPASLTFLHRAPLRPVAISYWARMLRSPMGELCFAAHARYARDEMHSLGVEALARVGDRDRAPHLWRLLDA